MTLLGLSFIVVGLYFFIKKPIRYLMALILVSCIFQAGSVLNIGSRGIPPYVLCEILFIIRVLPSLLKRKYLRFNRIIICFLCFLVLSVSLTLFMPFLYKGLYVIGVNTSDQHLAMMQMRDHLSFSGKNIVQICFLLSNFLTFYLFYIYKSCLTDKVICNIFLISILIVLIVGFWGFLNKTIGIPFPNDIVYSNIGYGQLYDVKTEFGLSRLNATFTEPSYCGGFLAASFWGIYKSSIKQRFVCFVILIALMLNMSSTGLVAFIVGVLFCLSFSVSRILKYIIVSVIVVLILSQTIYWDYIDVMLLGKSETLSGMARGNSLLLTWDLCKETNFIGLGLGSHRDFSFIGNLMAATGIIGMFLFLFIIIGLQIKNYKNRNYNISSKFLFYWGNIHWIAVFMALPDLSYSVIWMWMFASISQYKTIQYANRN